MHEPEPWQTNAPGPFLWIGDVTVWVAAGDQRFRIESRSDIEEVEGFEEAGNRARELAGV